jgi:hypothetical protein
MTTLLTLREAAAATGRTYPALYTAVYRGRLPATRIRRGRVWAYAVSLDDLARLRSGRRDWSPDDDERLLSLVGRVSTGKIAARLGRTPGAVIHRYRLLGESLRTAHGHLSASDTARVLGVSVTTVRYYIRTGQLGTVRYRPRYGNHRLWLVTQAAIEAWLRTRLTGPPARGAYRAWHWRRMPSGYYRNFAERVVFGKPFACDRHTRYTAKGFPNGREQT